MIVFEKIKWKNFLSTGNVFTQMVLNNAENTLIVGKNGSGKSTLLDALSFVLFNKPFRKINKPNLMNSINKKDLVVEIEFSIGKTNYKIIRGINPNIFEIYSNGELLNQSSESKQYQEILEKQILKVNHKSFCQVVILGSASFVPFMQLAAAERRAVIEDLLDLQIFTTMSGLLKDKITINKDKLSEKTNEIKIVEERIKMTKEHLVQIQNNNEKIILEKRQRISDANTKHGLLNQELKILQEEIESLENETSSINEIKSYSEKIKKAMYTLDSQIESVQKEINFLNQNDDCPTCKQNIQEDFKKISINDKNEIIKEKKNDLVKAETYYNEQNDKLKSMLKVMDDLTDKKMERNKILSNITNLISYKAELTNDLSSYTENKLDETLTIDSMLEEKSNLENQINEMLEAKETMGSVAVMLKDTGIKSRIIKRFVPIINNIINKYLSDMDFFVQFELDEKFNETIKSRYRDDFNYGSFSEGEKMRINLAILFAWRAVAKLRNSINTNLLIMDEVFDSSLDSNGTEEFMKILYNLTKDTNTFIISHNDNLFDKFTNVITFKKTKNFSKIVK